MRFCFGAVFESFRLLYIVSMCLCFVYLGISVSLLLSLPLSLSLSLRVGVCVYVCMYVCMYVSSPPARARQVSGASVTAFDFLLSDSTEADPAVEVAVAVAVAVEV